MNGTNPVVQLQAEAYVSPSLSVDLYNTVLNNFELRCSVDPST